MCLPLSEIPWIRKWFVRDKHLKDKPAFHIHNFKDTDS